ncbi:helix-turn-helix transcriptional regulator [Nitratireductor sp. B36]|uniref:helix-turn-helix transcriptional regulator n=1 Tax=Nitratireductor sp. B36 TaxID=2762059 RepID=UPI001E48F1A4|nr:helix-turn-helix transcriptional regulator [Nitratireductor sp. B36]MCC5778547.1 helix-turn-helix transcriptional regulator [Nitratireductor sp. B36]
MSFDSFTSAARQKPHLKLAFARAEGARRMAEALLALRREAGLTQTQLGKKLGVSQARISQVESGLLDHAPSIDFACAFAVACGGRLEFHASRNSWARHEREQEEKRRRSDRRRGKRNPQPASEAEFGRGSPDDTLFGEANVDSAISEAEVAAEPEQSLKSR